MSETKWTPGPWSWDAAPDHNWDVQVWSSPNSRVCFVAHDGEKGNRTGQANARLISAAPDMYEALDKFVEHYVGMINSGDCGFWNPEDEDFVKAARAALAKARGETS